MRESRGEIEPMRILYFGNGIRGVRCLEALVEKGRRGDIVAVITPPGEADQVAVSAKKHGFKIMQPERVNGEGSIREIKSLTPDLFILAGYNRILKKELISVPPLGAINLHGGKLPEYRGVAPINWQIINGETTGGCAILFVDEGIDTGDIIAQELYEITEEDTAATILEKTLELFPRLLLAVVNDLEQGRVTRVKQNPLQGCYYTRRYPRDGRIGWREMTAFQVYNLVRALVRPYPGAFFYYKHIKIIVNRSTLIPEEIKGTPGRIVLFRGEGMVVTARDRGILIEEIAIEAETSSITPRSYFKVLGEDLD